MMRSDTEGYDDSPRRWEDHVDSDPLEHRLRITSSIVGMPHWQLVDARSAERPIQPARSVTRHWVQLALRRFHIVWRRLESVAAARRGARVLSRLDDHLLRDMGLTRSQMEQLQRGVLSMAEIDRGRYRGTEESRPARAPISPLASAVNSGNRECANDGVMKEAA